MLSEAAISSSALGSRNRLHSVVISLLSVVGAVAVVEAERRGSTVLGLLLVGLLVMVICAVILARPVLGLYSIVVLDIALEPYTQGDGISKYTSYAQLDINTFAHAGIAFTPIELLMLLTFLSWLLRAIDSRTIHGGSLGRHVLIYGAFLVFGLAWGIFNHGNVKVGLFEMRDPFSMLVVYFLVTNLVRTQQQLSRLVSLTLVSLGIIVVWAILRLFLVFHGHSGGPDGEFSHNHEDAVFAGWLVVICVSRLVAGGVPSKRWWALLFAVPALFLMLEMQRRAASVCLAFGFVMVATALYFRSRRWFFRIVPAAVLLTLVYGSVMWNSSSVLAQPIRAWKAHVDPTAVSARDQSSDTYRVVEMKNVRATILSAPLTGVGFGRKFLSVYPMLVFNWWTFQFYTPHADVFWIWLKVGAGGFAVFLLMLITALMRSGEILRRSSSPSYRFAALLSATYVGMLLVFAYVDIGLAYERTEIVLGAMLGLLGVTSKLIDAPAVPDLRTARARLRNSHPAGDGAAIPR
ncbi:MAG: O-antigen ligase family protein [Chloroflexi bacterium]|nr:O-antigen ligase family protein [Chloroflexota bacterium]